MLVHLFSTGNSRAIFSQHWTVLPTHFISALLSHPVSKHSNTGVFLHSLVDAVSALESSFTALLRSQFPTGPEKQQLFKPLFKKNNLDSSLMNSYRPISNLLFLKENGNFSASQQPLSPCFDVSKDIYHAKFH